MNLRTGSRLGPYEILAPLGAGGMGEVFRGRDTRLDRSVAIKVLPVELARNAQFQLRLEREARTISQLNHPNICTLYDVGHENGTDFLVMELIEGESLADRLARGPLPLEQVLRYGIQIAGALGKAHRHGIVHRDLKPGNIMITKDGAKLLDFGLAKATDPVLNAQHTALPTQQKPITEQGTVLGTYQYMAPEQLEGLEADARTDMFALGAVLYEMATGKRAFEGKTRTSLIAAIVSSEPPPLAQVQPLTPPALEHVIRKCLAKDPEDRWQSAQDVAAELRWISEGGSQAGTSLRPARSWLALALVVLLPLIGIAAWYAGRRFSRPPADVLHFQLEIPNLRGMALSPDGRSLAYVTVAAGRRTLWVQSFREETPRRLFDGDAWTPFWSRDGKRIGFFSDDSLKSIAAEGGSPKTICEAINPGVGTWNSKGVILFSADGSIYRVSDRGGEPAILLRGSQGTHYSGPHFLPDGENFLFVMSPVPTPSDSIRAWRGVASLRSPAVKKLFEAFGGSGPQYAEPGYILHRVRDDLIARPFDRRSLAVKGDPFVVRDGVVGFVAAPNGTIAYGGFPTDSQKQILAVDRQGRELRIVGPPASIWHMALSPDERSIAIEIFDPKARTTDVWTRDVASGRVTTRLTFTTKFEWMMTWAPDGSRIFFASNQTDNSDVFSIPAGGGTPAHVYGGGIMQAPMDISRDGRYLLVFDTSHGFTNTDILTVPLGGGPAIPVANTKFNEQSARFSPDGKWIAYDSDKSGRRELYLQDFPAATKSIQISSEGGYNPAWSADGRELYYTDGEKLIVVPIEQLSPEPRLGASTVLFKLPAGDIFHGYARYPYAPAKNGREFYVLKEISPRVDPPIHVILNATTALEPEGDR